MEGGTKLDEALLAMRGRHIYEIVVGVEGVSVVSTAVCEAVFTVCFLWMMLSHF